MSSCPICALCVHSSRYRPLLRVLEQDQVSRAFRMAGVSPREHRRPLLQYRFDSHELLIQRRRSQLIQKKAVGGIARANRFAHFLTCACVLSLARDRVTTAGPGEGIGSANGPGQQSSGQRQCSQPAELLRLLAVRRTRSEHEHHLDPRRGSNLANGHSSLASPGHAADGQNRVSLRTRRLQYLHGLPLRVEPHDQHRGRTASGGSDGHGRRAGTGEVAGRGGRSGIQGDPLVQFGG